MALTLIRKKNEEGEFTNLAFKTSLYTIPAPDEDEGTIQKLYGETKIVDDKLETLSQAKRYEISYTEEEFHTLLRVEAAKAGHLITSHSTDPEWNPEGYSKNLEDEL